MRISDWSSDVCSSDLAALTRAWTTADLIQAMLAVDIWCGEVQTHLEAADDPQVRHMNAIASYDHPVAGPVKVVAPAVKLSRPPAAHDPPAPLIGPHSRQTPPETGVRPDEHDEAGRD